MVNNKERWAYFYDYKFTSYPEGSDNIPLEDLLKGLKKLIKDKNAVIFNRKKTAALRVTGISIANETVTLLIQLADKDISNPAFSNIVKGGLREVEKELGEGVAITAHITISRSPSINRNVYVASIEKVPGINSGRIASFLQAMFKEIRKKENMRWEDENGKNRIHFPQLTASGHISESLKEDLEQGTLRGFEFISYDTNDNDGFDEETYLIPQEKVLKVGVSRFASGEAALEIIKSAASLFRKKNYDKLKIKVRKDDTERWVQADVDDIENTAFVRHEKMLLENELKSQCLSKINAEINEKMVAFLSAEQEQE
ncbi:MAG: hypothetical protein L3J61_00515 [Ghiorsea sp.]|nr:hypothetical protein [Ghiorsea sp.]